MTKEQIMDRIQDADIILSMIEPEENYKFSLTISKALQKLGKYSVMYYNKCEQEGITYKEATDQLGKHLRKNLGMEINAKG